MRYQDLGLNEADNYDFGDRTTAVLDKLGQRAGAAYQKFKGDYKSAKSDLESKQKENQAAAEKAAKVAQKTQTKTDAAAAKAAKPEPVKAAQIPTLVAKIITSRTPMHAADIEEMKDFDAKQLQTVNITIDQMKSRLAKIPRALRKGLKTSDFLDAQQRTDKSLNKYLADQPDAGKDAAEGMLMKDMFSESEVWQGALLTDDAAQAAEKLVELMQAISRDFERRNLAGTGAGKPVALPQSDGVVRLVSTQRQIIGDRLIALTGAVEQLGGTALPEKKPKKDAWDGFDGPSTKAPEQQPTQESLARVRRLVERMNQA